MIFFNFFHSFNVKMISLFNFNKQLANSKPFPEQYSIPDETKYQDSICIPRTSSTTFFCNKLHLFCRLFLLGPCPHHLRVLPHLCSIEDWPLKSMDIGCGRHQLLVGLKSRLWLIPKVARLTLKLSVNTCRIFDVVHWKMSCDNIPLGPFESPPLKFSVIVISEIFVTVLTLFIGNNFWRALWGTFPCDLVSL